MSAARRTTKRTWRRALGAAIGSRVRALRQQRGLSRLDLARAVDLSATAIAKIEEGSVEPRVGSLVVLARVLGVKPEDLLAGTPESRPAGRGHKLLARIVRQLREHEDDPRFLRVVARLIRDLEQLAPPKQ